MTNTTHTWDGFTDALEEVKDARVWGGIHYRFSTELGSLIGEGASDQIDQHFFVPYENRGTSPGIAK